MSYKIVNQINNIVSKLVSEKQELERELFLLKNAVVKTDDGTDYSAIFEVTTIVIGKEIAEYRDWNSKLKYDESGINFEFEKWFKIKLEEYYTDKKLYKNIPYNELTILVRPYLKEEYDRRVDDVKMEYVRSHKENENE